MSDAQPRLMVTVDAEDLALLVEYAQKTIEQSVAEESNGTFVPHGATSYQTLMRLQNRARARAALFRLREIREVVEALAAIERMRT